MATDSVENISGVKFPLLTQDTTSSGKLSKPTVVNAASLLAAYKIAKTSENPYKTLSTPIDRIIGPFLRPGYGLQISAPPGAYVEQLLIGLVKSVTTSGKGAFVVDMQNKLKAEALCEALGGDNRTDRVHYHTCYKPDEITSLLTTLPNFLSNHPQISLLILSSLSFPLQLEENYSKRTALLNQIRELILRVTKQHNLVTVISSNMSMHFVNPDGSRGTADNNTTAVMVPQIDLSCKSISSLIISRDDQKSGRAVLISGTNQQRYRTKFNYVGLEFRDKPLDP